MRPRACAQEETLRDSRDVEAKDHSSKRKRRGFKVHRYHALPGFLAFVALLFIGITLHTAPSSAVEYSTEPRRAFSPSEIAQQSWPIDAAGDARVQTKPEVHTMPEVPSLTPSEKMQLTTISITGLLNVGLNKEYFEDAANLVAGRETYWSRDGMHFSYYCKNSDVPDLLERWCLAERSNLDAISDGECRAVARTVQKSFNPLFHGAWEDYSQKSSHFLGPKRLASTPSSGKLNVVTLGDFLRPEYNSDFWERRDLRVNQHETYWCSFGEFFLYWCSADVSQVYATRWVLAPSEQYVQIERGDCTGMVKAPKDRDILDRSLVRGWEELTEDESWMSFTGRSGVTKLSKLKELRTSLDNQSHAQQSDQHHSQHGQAHACIRCGSKIHGPVPTSLIAHAYYHCSWKFQPRKRLEDAVDESKYDVHVAKSLCIDRGVDCIGVTCQGGHESCSLRSGAALIQTRDDFEWTYVKACPKKLESGCDELGSTSEERGMTDGMGDKSEMRDATIVVMGGNNLIALKECLTSLSKLVDIYMVKIMVALSPNSLAEDADVIIQEVETSSGLQIQRWRAPSPVSFPLNSWAETTEAKVAHHYNVTFEKVFIELEVEYAVFVDEDLIFSPDFLSLFRSTAWLLRRDPSLWCISAWNENAFRVSDACRLMRTSNFPGRAFLLRRSIWRFIRSSFPPIMTNGWQSQMRVVLRTNTKECIIPEVPRVHRPNRHGSIDTTIVAHSLMEYATVPTTCSAHGDCSHFGNVTFLLEKKYEQVMHTVIRSHRRLRFTRAGLIEGADRLDSSTVHILPYLKQDYSHELAVLLGHRPGGNEFKSLPHELYADHFGVVYGKLSNLAHVILVDKRSTHKHLLPNERTSLSAYHKPLAASVGESCAVACSRSGGRCDWSQLDFFNSCRFLRSNFDCKANECVAGDGLTLPAFVSNKSSPQNGQCLITFNTLVPGPDSCSLVSTEEARLCACGYREVTTTPKPQFHMRQLLFTTIYDPLVLAKRPEVDTRLLTAMEGAGHKHVNGHVARIGVNPKINSWEHEKISNKYNRPQGSVRAAMENIYYIHNHNVSHNPRRWDFIKVSGVYLEHFPMGFDGSEDFQVRDLDSSYNECEMLDNPPTKGDNLQDRFMPLDVNEAALNRCTGVTCDHELKECTCRSGRSIKKSHTGEITFIHKTKYFMGNMIPTAAEFPHH